MATQNKPLRPLTLKEKKVLEFVEEFIGIQGIAPSYKEIKDHFGFASFNSVQRYLKQLQNKDYIYIPPGNQKRAITVLQPSQAIQNFMNAEAPTLASMSVNNPTTQSPFFSTQQLMTKEASPWSPPVAESLSVPLLGRVAAGSPIEAFEYNEYIDVPPSMIRNPEKTFALRVEGQSMIEDGILDGDILFVQRQERASNGETVVAVVDNEATVKRFYAHSENKKVINKNSQSNAHLRKKQLQQTPLVELRPANSSMESFWFQPDEVNIQGVVVGLIRRM